MRTAYDNEQYASIVFFETKSGGAVYSVGSMAYIGALNHNGFDNDIARMTGNVLKRFSDPTPFKMA
jgi:N,N-dimethylformamidase